MTTEYIQAAVFLFFQALLFNLYPIWILRAYGLQESISHSWYALPEKLRPLFTLWLWGMAGTMIVVLILLDHWIWFVSAAGLVFCGTAAAFKLPVTRTVHYTGAICGIGAAAAGCFIAGQWWVLVACVVSIVAIILLKIPCRIWFIENTCSVFCLLGIQDIIFAKAKAIVEPLKAVLS